VGNPCREWSSPTRLDDDGNRHVAELRALAEKAEPDATAAYQARAALDRETVDIDATRGCRRSGAGTLQEGWRGGLL